MESAVVTLTCPSCGGQVEGVRTTADEQTIKCTFCGTDMHIPRIGEVVRERVVREVVREVPAEPDVYPDPAPVSLRRKSNPAVAVTVVIVFIAAAIGLMIYLKHDADQTIDDMNRRDADQAACEADCKTQCEHAGDKEPPDDPMMPGMRQTMVDADRQMCETQCSTGCYQPATTP